MQVEGKGSRVLRNNNGTRENKDGRGEGKRYAGLANSVRS